LRLVGQYPWQAALIASLCLSGWLWRGRQEARVNAAKWETAYGDQRLAYEKASQDAHDLAVAQVKAVEARSEQKAKEADHAHEIALRVARSATDRFVAANRVRPDQVGSCPAPSASEGNGPGLPPEVPSDPIVAVREPDLQALVEWATVGVEAHNHAVDRINAGTAKAPMDLPQPELSARPQP
jgi:hypothetical protein